MAGFSLDDHAEDLSLALKFSEQYRIQSACQSSPDAILLQAFERR